MSQCIKCNSPVTDSIEVQIEQHGKIKLGRHRNEGWICDDCFLNVNQKESNLVAEDNQQQQHEKMEPVKASDVSPNTPKADEAEI
jgi:hypothetical protein